MRLSRKCNVYCSPSRTDITRSSFISTMETETLSSRNIIDLLLREKFNSSICPFDEEKMVNGTSAEFVYGWDC